MKINRKAFSKTWVHKHIISSQAEEKKKKKRGIYIQNAVLGYHPEILIVPQLIQYLCK